jgi:hypothetical protein
MFLDATTIREVWDYLAKEKRFLWLMRPTVTSHIFLARRHRRLTNRSSNAKDKCSERINGFIWSTDILTHACSAMACVSGNMRATAVVLLAEAGA